MAFNRDAPSAYIQHNVPVKIKNHSTLSLKQAKGNAPLINSIVLKNSSRKQRKIKKFNITVQTPYRNRGSERFYLTDNNFETYVFFVTITNLANQSNNYVTRPSVKKATFAENVRRITN